MLNSARVYIWFKLQLDGPGAKAGLKVGDVITRVDSIEINKMSELRRYIYTKRPNDSITVTVIRGNKEYTINMILGRRA